MKPFTGVCPRCGQIGRVTTRPDGGQDCDGCNGRFATVERTRKKRATAKPAEKKAEPKKYESSTQPGVYFWAEANELDNGQTFCVISQAEGFPPTEAFDDWFKHEKDADEIAQKLAKGEL